MTPPVAVSGEICGSLFPFVLMDMCTGNFTNHDLKLKIGSNIIGKTNRNWNCLILREVISCYRTLTKSSKSLENKGFFAVSSPYPFIQFHMMLPLLGQFIRAKARERKSHNTTQQSVTIEGL